MITITAAPGIVDKARLPYIEAAYYPLRREHPHQAALFVTFHIAYVGLYVNRGVATDAAQPHGVETVVTAQSVACAYPDVSAGILGHAVHRIARQPPAEEMRRMEYPTPSPCADRGAGNRAAAAKITTPELTTGASHATKARTTQSKNIRKQLIYLYSSSTETVDERAQRTHTAINLL